MSEEEVNESGDLFEPNFVRDLNNEDFALASTEGLTLYAEGCSLVLFYDKSPKSRMMGEVWEELASQFGDVNFYGVNLAERRDIAKRIGNIRNDANHMFNKFTLAKAPYIIVYRESSDAKVSYPQAFYNGQLSTEEIANWVVDLACQPGYTDYVSNTFDEDVEVPVNTIVDEDVDQNGEVRPVLSREYNDIRPVLLPPRKTTVQRVLAAREKELEATELSPEDYGRMTPMGTKKGTLLNPKGRRATSGVGYIEY